MELPSDTIDNHLNHLTVNCCQTILHIFYTAMRNRPQNQSFIVSKNIRRTKLKHNVILITNIKSFNYYVLILFILVANLFRPAVTSKNSIHYNHNYKMVNHLVRVLYQSGVSLSPISFIFNQILIL